VHRPGCLVRQGARRAVAACRTARASGTAESR
jgi:hypothetical protein